jgi:hypothetical protein
VPEYHSHDLECTEVGTYHWFEAARSVVSGEHIDLGSEVEAAHIHSDEESGGSVLAFCCRQCRASRLVAVRVHVCPEEESGGVTPACCHRQCRACHLAVELVLVAGWPWAAA